MHHLADAYRRAGRPAEAVTIDEAVLKLRQSKLGADHRDTLYSMHALARDYRDIGRQNETVNLLESALKLHRGRPGPAQPEMLWVMSDLADALRLNGRPQEAVLLENEKRQLRRLSNSDQSERLSREAEALIEARKGKEKAATAPEKESEPQDSTNQQSGR
jgi:hypothetical protein